MGIIRTIKSMYFGENGFFRFYLRKPENVVSLVVIIGYGAFLIWAHWRWGW